MNEEKNEFAEEETTEELIAEYDRKRRNRADDVIATQAVVCILAALLFFAAGRIYPEITGEVFAKLRGLVTDSREVMPNPIDLLIGYIAEL
ncbi:MAG: hypothetical protein K6G33_00440 [Ruminococcus sp.]|uniref:hypothetical protein n=1 Tax=Ruminococcus sp. TaxID=41978 RepID=UPI0025D1A055|nr:hypothetical protein [Ruminococcus sp.]MCR5599201.1 hypothetical protein [Ruminococcus sp.]